jgi:hypothetical protein
MGGRGSSEGRTADGESRTVYSVVAAAAIAAAALAAVLPI